MIMLFVNDHIFLFFIFFLYLFIICLIVVVNLYWCLLIYYSTIVLMFGVPIHRGLVPLRRSRKKDVFIILEVKVPNSRYASPNRTWPEYFLLK